VQSKDEGDVPLSVSCWPSPSGGETDVTVEYESLVDFDIHNAVITIPCHLLPRIKHVRARAFALPDSRLLKRNLKANT
jgi:hypothetical protein